MTSSDTGVVTVAGRGVLVTVIVMAYNEAASLEAVVEEILADARAHGLRAELVIVDDGSTDGTTQIADRLAATRDGVVAIHHGVNRGIGEVYGSGFGAATGDYVTFLPADGQFFPSVVSEFAECMAAADLVLGFLPEQAGSRSLTGKALSAAECAFMWMLFGRLPRFQGVMMFRRSLLEQLGVRAGGRGWGVLRELVVRASRARLRVISVPTRLRPRASGGSKVNNLATVWSNVRQAVALRRAL